VNELIVLAADPTMSKIVGTLLQRHEALDIASISSRCLVVAHPERDGGVASGAVDFLRPFRSRYRRSMVICDLHGCGHSGTRRDVETALESGLALNGWGSDCAAVVIEPELEVWLWQRSPHLEAALGWKGRNPDLWKWAAQEFAVNQAATKPDDPKTCVEKALKLVGKIRSAAAYINVASKVSLRHCTDPSFVKFRETMQRWFPAGGRSMCD
jgi:hypothetical protein